MVADRSLASSRDRFRYCFRRIRCCDEVNQAGLTALEVDYGADGHHDHPNVQSETGRARYRRCGSPVPHGSTRVVLGWKGLYDSATASVLPVLGRRSARARGHLLFGFYQTAFGYLPYQMEWYQVAGYTALGNISTGLAPISFFSSRTEHAIFLVIVAVILAAAFLKGRRGLLVLIVPLLVAVILNGSRGPMVMVLGTFAVMWAFMGVSRRTWIPRGLLAVAICTTGLFWGLTFATSLDLDPQFQHDLDRQARIFSSEETTVDTHTSLMIGGYLTAVRQPLGFGLGMTTKAAAAFGGGGRGTETDVGDVMISLGLVGGIVYHIVIGLTLFTAAGYWRRSRTTLALAILGILIATIFSWLRGGLYAVSPILWLCVGAVDQFAQADKKKKKPSADRVRRRGPTLSVQR